jgi:GGDEF domain-containing protein
LLNPDLPGQQGAATFRLAQAAAPNVPVILVVNPGDEALAVRLIREGAQDFLFRKSIDCAPLSHALRNAVLRHRLLAASRAAERTDSLTGLANRADFLASAGRDRSLAERIQRPWLLMVAEPSNLAAEAGPFAEPFAGPFAGPFNDQRRDIEMVEAADHLRGIATQADALARIDERHFAMSVFVDDTETAEEASSRLQTAAARRGIGMGVSVFRSHSPISVDAMIGQALADLARKVGRERESQLPVSSGQDRANFAGTA